MESNRDFVSTKEYLEAMNFTMIFFSTILINFGEKESIFNLSFTRKMVMAC